MTHTYELVGSEFRPVLGTLLLNVHGAEECMGRYCTIHRPSDHPMRDMRLLWRDDRGFFERICPHGIGHPDPDQIRFWRETLDADDADAQAMHGCCGTCCWTPPREP